MDLLMVRRLITFMVLLTTLASEGKLHISRGLWNTHYMNLEKPPYSYTY